MITPTPSTVAAVVRNAIGAHRATSTRVTDGVVRVTVHGAEGPTNDPDTLARVVAAAALRQGWDSFRTGATVLVLLPEPAEPEPLRIAGREVRDGDLVYVTGRWQVLTDVRQDGSHFRATTDRGSDLLANAGSLYDVRRDV